MPDDKARRDELKRLLCAARCENLIAALTLQSAILRGGEAIAPLDPAGLALAQALAPPRTSIPNEDLCRRIDALWAAWLRPGKVGAKRNEQTIAQNARVVLLAAIDTAVRLVEFERVVRAIARERLGTALTNEERELLSRQDVEAARRCVDGQRGLVVTVYGVMTVELASIESLADDRSALDVGELARWYFAEAGCREYAEGFTPELARRSIAAWVQGPGHPRKDVAHEPKWDVLTEVQREMGLGTVGALVLRKQWEKFRRRGLSRQSLRSSTPSVDDAGRKELRGSR